MSCSNCFNGCSEIISDKCVKYTGPDIPQFEIETGDSLYVIEEKIFSTFTSIISGAGILPTLSEEDICSSISDYLSGEGPYTLNEYLTAVIKVVCDLVGSVEMLQSFMASLNSIYTIGCLTVEDETDTHEVLQATIDFLCQLKDDVDAVIVDLNANYVKIVDLDTYVQAYLDTLPGATLVSSKMIPYCPIPFVGDIAGKFDGSGAGIGDWVDIYLCNGNNGTPDYRGRTVVGMTSMLGGAFNPAVDPGIVGNPTYSLGTTEGANNVVLTEPQMPGHTHTNTVTIDDPGHSHEIPGSVNTSGGSGQYAVNNTTNNTEDVITESNVTGLDGDNVTVTINPAGGNAAHPNIQPSIAAYYIVYIP